MTWDTDMIIQIDAVTDMRHVIETIRFERRFRKMLDESLKARAARQRVYNLNKKKKYEEDQ